MLMSSLAIAPAPIDSPARMYEGFGNYHRAITTSSAEAQRWFDQGLQLLYGFNHDEAIRSFRQAAVVDPTCAMAWWGVAYAHGLHINNPAMTEEQSRVGWEAAQEAVQRLDRASPAERALIEAVAKRYAWPAPEDRKPLDEAYAAAMGEAWKAHPNDPDIGALYAESLMNLQPWDYWTNDGQPKGRIDEIIGAIEAVLAASPNHPGANHFYIHAVEASQNPGKALASADRLRGLVPGSGLLVHMPSHIDIRLGRYDEAIEANQSAIKADQAYLAVAPTPRFYSLYFAHNLHFLAYASMMEGRYALAMDAARRVGKDVHPDFLRDYLVIADSFMSTPLHVMIRFGKWEEILREPEPATARLMSRAMRHYARGIALSALGRTAEARAELEAFDEVAGNVGDDWFVGNNQAKVILPMARRMMEGEMAYREGNREQAFMLLRQAVAMEEALVYDEPPGWMQPVRHALGALLMGDGRHAEAQAVYEADLQRHPDNGWSLLGLEQSLRAQGKTKEADVVAEKLASAWNAEDVQPTSSCYCQPARR
jgi:tetratricopeptide (TPR) repeat protein